MSGGPSAALFPQVPNVGKRVVGVIRRVNDEDEDGVEVNVRFFREKIGMLSTQLKEVQKESNTRAQRCERLDNQVRHASPPRDSVKLRR